MAVEFVRAVVPESGAQVSVSRKFAELRGLEILNKPAKRAGRVAVAKPKKSVAAISPDPAKFKSDPTPGSDESPEPQGVSE